MTHYSISAVTNVTGTTADTLRYYEKIKLLPKIDRIGGKRLYHEHDIGRIRFIKRAQAMNFSLLEIKALLQMRDDPNSARPSVRQLTANKLHDVEQRLHELQLLKTELDLLVHLCQNSKNGCPILSRIDTPLEHETPST